MRRYLSGAAEWAITPSCGRTGSRPYGQLQLEVPEQLDLVWKIGIRTGVDAAELATFARIEPAGGHINILRRANPIDWEIRTPLGTFTTDDRATWRTEPHGWTAELRRSKNGRHWFLAVFEAGVYR